MSEDPDQAVSAVSVKVPPFWPHDVELWFLNLEGQFALAKITAQITKFHYVVGNLPPEYSRNVRQFLKDPKDATAYDDLKAELLKSTSKTLQERLQQLVDREELGDRKPSQFLATLKNLMGETTVSDELMRGFFLRRMPPMVCAVLATLPSDAPVSQLATVADAVIAAAPSAAVPPIQQVNTEDPSAPKTSSTPAGAVGGLSVDDRLARLEQQMANLNKQLKRLNYRNRSRGRSVSRDTSHEPNKEGPCFFHRKFGDKARRCEAPCTYSKNE